jgi:hypothetical protein
MDLKNLVVFKHAMELDAKNGNTQWGDAIHTETSQTLEYGTWGTQ